MKKVIFILFFLFSLALNAQEIVYVASEDGNFVKSNLVFGSGPSIMQIANTIGYNSNEFYTYGEDKCIALFMLLTEQPFALIIEGDKGDIITKEEASCYLTKFNYKKEQQAFSIENKLQNGINDKNLTREFLERATNNKAVNDEILDVKNGYKYILKDDILIAFTPMDGLNKWAKEFKGTPLFKRIERLAKNYYASNEDITNEINRQFDAFVSIGDGYLSIGYKEPYNYNFALLRIDLYKPKIKMSEFMDITHGDAEIYKIGGDISMFTFNNNIYIFDKNKELIDIK